jgi:hypothetical protein
MRSITKVIASDVDSDGVAQSGQHKFVGDALHMKGPSRRLKVESKTQEEAHCWRLITSHPQVLLLLEFLEGLRLELCFTVTYHFNNL